MTLLTGVLIVLLFIAVLYIVVDRVMAWLTRHGGVTIRIEPVDDEDE